MLGQRRSAYNLLRIQIKVGLKRTEFTDRILETLLCGRDWSSVPVTSLDDCVGAIAGRSKAMFDLMMMNILACTCGFFFIP